MPVRPATTAVHQGQNKSSASGNNRTGAKGPRDHPRPRRDEPKAEESVSPPGPIIKTQIVNTAKASSGKSFLDALRVGVSKRSATVEPQPVVAPEPAVAPAVEAADAEPGPAAVPVADAPQPIADEPSVIEQGPSTSSPQQQHHQPQPLVTLPEADGHFSWANDDDYSFVNQFTQPPQVEAAASDAPTYLVRYPQAVIDAQKNGSVVFKAPADHQTLASAVSALEKDRRELDEDRRNFEEYRKKWDNELNEKQAQLLVLERQLKDQGDSLQKERSKLLEQQQQLKQQQQQQQQSSSVCTATAAPQTSAPHVPPPASNYAYSPSMQDNLQWAHPPRSDNWAINNGMAAPPYEHNRYYGNAPYQPVRGKPFGGRAGDVPPHMGRGNPMRSNPHVQGNFNGRPMGGGDVRGPTSDTGVNPIFNQRSQVGYMQSSNFHGQW